MVKESRYVKLAGTILCILRNARIPFFLHRNSNHIFTIWQHLSLLTIRQYEGKSYRMFTEWLVEAHYLRTFLKISSRISHFTTLQKFTDRITGTIHSGKDNFFFHSPYNNCQTNIPWNRLIWMIQAKPCITQYYTERNKLRKKWIIKLSVGADMLKQIIICTTIKIRRAPKRHDNIHRFSTSNHNKDSGN